MTAKKMPKKGATPASKKPAPAKRAPTRKAAAATVDKLLAAKPADDPQAEMNPRMLAFAKEYVRTLNGTASYMATHPGCKVNTAAVESSRLLRNPKVRAYIEQHREKLATALDFGKEDVIRELIAVATANPNEVTQMRQVSCDACWPELEGDTPIWLEPNPECPRCDGSGTPRAWFADTRNLSPVGQRLFSCVQVTKQGMRIVLRDQDGALDKLAKVFGAYEVDNEQKGKAAADVLRELFLKQLHAGAGRAQVVREPGRPKVQP